MSDSSADRSETERRGEVLDVLRDLLAEGRNDDVVSLVNQLVANNSELAVRAAEATTLKARNAELEKQLERILDRYKKNEAVSKAQLVLFIDALSRGEAGDVLEDDDPRRAANQDLREASGIDDPDDEPKTKPPRKQPVRKPAPPELPRIENPIAVPEPDRACPRCGKERTCVGHDITEVIDLV
ncbi:hypothetical protein FBR04_21590, partial [Betaproteobacteria bacterium PRO7]|nr:hypothetical protein [Betaproteobacteria bacterium PRO7]